MVDFVAQQREANAIRKDMQKVYKIISDAKAGYIKTKLKAKCKKHAEEAAHLFADLVKFSSKQEIQDHYGWEYFSRLEYERLMIYGTRGNGTQKMVQPTGTAL